ncbi:MAG: hypothetical protein IAE86_09065 [Burkholderiaceae bacterium]|jgi:hypothetical protein|nr:hypothetical protein [Burkholderiaceae bacterium]
MTWTQRSAAVVVIVLYVVVASGLVFAAFVLLSPPSKDGGYKDFAAVAGIALTAAGAFVGIIASFIVLGTQIQASRDLEDKKKEILKSVEDHREAILKRVEDHKLTILMQVEDRKKEITKELAELNTRVSRQTEFLTQTRSAKAIAYEKLFIAANGCYRELELLGAGKFDAERMAEYERGLREAEGLAANLDDEDQRIVKSLIQLTFNITDAASLVNVEGIERESAYKAIWEEYVREFGQAMEAVRERSLFRNKPVDA